MNYGPLEWVGLLSKMLSVFQCLKWDKNTIGYIKTQQIKELSRGERFVISWVYFLCCRWAAECWISGGVMLFKLLRFLTLLYLWKLYKWMKLDVFYHKWGMHCLCCLSHELLHEMVGKFSIAPGIGNIKNFQKYHDLCRDPDVSFSFVKVSGIPTNNF